MQERSTASYLLMIREHKNCKMQRGRSQTIRRIVLLLLIAFTLNLIHVPAESKGSVPLVPTDGKNISRISLSHWYKMRNRAGVSIKSISEDNPPYQTNATIPPAMANNTESSSEILKCFSEEDKSFKFKLTTRRNSTGHWLADMDVQPGNWASQGQKMPFEVHLEHHTRTCVSCENAMPPYARISIIEPPPARAPNASGYRYFPGFGFYKRHQEERSWREARAACQEEGADLVVINSEAEAKLLLELAAPLLFLQPAAAWNAEAYVGLYDFHNEGNFVSVDGLSLNETGYVHWSPGEPNNHREEDCVTIVRNAMYNDVGCSKIFEFICEFPE